MTDQIQIIDQPSANDLNKTNEELFRFKSVFPFDFFPDSVILDRFKINIIKRDFFLSHRIITIPLSGSIGVKVNSGPFLSQIEVFDPQGGQKSVMIRNLINADSTRFRELVEGLIVAIKQGVNTTKMTKDELINSAMQWGAIVTE